jgi:hypothetical protein
LKKKGKKRKKTELTVLSKEFKKNKRRDIRKSKEKY